MRILKSNVTILLSVLCFFFVACSETAKRESPEHPAYHNVLVQPFTDSVNSDPQNAYYYFLRSEALLRIHEDSLALADAQQALQIDSLNPRYAYAVGYIQISLKKYDEAIPLLRKLLVSDPFNTGAQFLLLSAFLDTKRINEAQALVDAALAARPRDPRIRYWQALIKTAQGDRTAAIGIARTLMTEEPDNYEVSYQLADWYREEGLPEAISQYEYTFRMDTTDVDPLYDIATIYELKKDWRKAKELYRTCILRDPGYTDAYVSIGKILLHQDSAEKALRQFNIAIATDPVNATAYFNKGLCFEQLNLKDSAISAYRQALVFDESIKEARARWQKLQQDSPGR